MEHDTEKKNQYDNDKEALLGIDELYVLKEKSDVYNYFTEKKIEIPDKNTHDCDKPTLRSKGYKNPRGIYMIFHTN